VLIDGDGRLAALYKGQVSVQRVLDDLAALGLDSDARRSRSVPFAGRWHEPLNKVSLVPVLNALTRGGFLEEADEYTRRMGTVNKEPFQDAIVRLGMALYRQGDGTKAKQHFSVAVKIDPAFVGVETELGEQRVKEGRPESAAALYREALRRNPDSVRALNNLAWLLSTHPSDTIRDGVKAVELARKAAQLTERSDPSILDTLAAAHAEAGDFVNAIEAATDAMAKCRLRGRLALAKNIDQRLKTYQRHQPYRDVQGPR
jgi:tetratricopeptide (TPR) repeat protein